MTFFLHPRVGCHLAFLVVDFWHYAFGVHLEANGTHVLYVPLCTNASIIANLFFLLVFLGVDGTSLCVKSCNNNNKEKKTKLIFSCTNPAKDSHSKKIDQFFHWKYTISIDRL